MAPDSPTALEDALARATALAATQAIDLPPLLASSQPLRVAAGEIRTARIRRALTTQAAELVSLVEGDADHRLVRDGLAQLIPLTVSIETTTLSTFALSTLLGAQARHGGEDDEALGDEVLAIFRAVAEAERGDAPLPLDDPAALSRLLSTLRLTA